MIIALLIVWGVVAVICASVASSKGRNGGLWFLLGLGFGFVGLLVICSVGPAEKQTFEQPRRRSPGERVDWGVPQNMRNNH